MIKEPVELGAFYRSKDDKGILNAPLYKIVKKTQDGGYLARRLLITNNTIKSHEEPVFLSEKSILDNLTEVQPNRIRNVILNTIEKVFEL